MDQQYCSKFWFGPVIMAVLILPSLIASESVEETNYANEGTLLNKKGEMTHHKKNLIEKDLMIIKRHALEVQQGDPILELLEELKTTVDEIQRGQEDLLAKIESCETEPEPEQVYIDCHSAWELGIREPGVYTLSPTGYPSFSARCEFDHLHGWTVIQRRFDGSTTFYLPWDSYKRGFGDPRAEYWLGNDNIYALTRTNRKLSIYLRRYDGQEGTANYSTFYINNEADNYRLTIAGYSGSVGDKMATHNNQEFSTRDRDHDAWGSNCAVSFTGAWWYDQCYLSNLNGVWTSSRHGGTGNIVWTGSWGSTSKLIQRTTMMVTRD